jgi:4-amino-4-deoxy-L-arabinose transferase-like glycosyltransferase
MPGIAPAHGKWYYLLLGGFFIGMGILTKGPVAYLIAVLTMGVYWVYQRFRLYVNIPQFLVFTVMTTLVTLTWYGIETLKNGPEFIQRFNAYQVELFSTASAGHSGFPGYHFVVLLVGCFPASIFALRAFFRLPEEEAAYQRDFRIWMKFLFWTVLILFTIVRSKIVHYSSMCYFPLTFLTAVVIHQYLNGALSLTRWMRAGLWIIGGLYILLTVALPFIGMNAEVLAPLFDDPFARANLEAEVRWTGLEIVPGLFLLAVLFISLQLLKRKRKIRGLQVLYGGVAVFVLLTLIFFIKRIEGYSQRAAIEFFESKAGQDIYLISHGYKTYAHYFYGRVTPENRRVEDNEQWALTGDIDKEVFISSKIHRADELRALEDLEELYSKNGFVFFRRRPR